MKEKAILLTGATGFLGSALLKALLKKKKRVVALKRSFSDTRRVDSLKGEALFYNVDRNGAEQAFVENRIEIVIHTATNYGRQGEDTLNIIESNLLFPLSLLELSRKNGVSCFINTDTLQYKYLNAYTLSKGQFVEWQKRSAGETKCVNIKIEHMYGPGDDNNKFIVWFLDCLRKRVKEIPLTDGNQKRDFIYIDDIVRAYVLLIENHDRFDQFCEFELGSGVAISIRELVFQIKDVFELLSSKSLSIDMVFGAIPYRPNEPMELKANPAAMETLGWRPKVGLAEGLEKVVREYLR